MPKVHYSYEVNGKLVTENGSLIQICSLSNCSLLPSLTVCMYYIILAHLKKIILKYHCNTYFLIWVLLKKESMASSNSMSLKNFVGWKGKVIFFLSRSRDRGCIIECAWAHFKTGVRKMSEIFQIWIFSISKCR